MNRMADVTKYKALLPKELKYPLPDGTVDIMLNVKANTIENLNDDKNYMALHYCLLAALIELKERRMQDESHG